VNPLIWARVALSPRADAVHRQMNDAEHARFGQIIAVIKNAPEDGKFYALASDNTRLLQMTGANMHVIYAVKYWPIGRVLLIVTIEIRDWEPKES
jgi:hypothetical protein